MEITRFLLNAQSADTYVRKQAEDTLRQFQEQSLPVFWLSLSRELAGEDKPVDSRKLAGLILKNYLDAKEQNRKYELVQRWLALDVSVKSQIKACLLQTLSSPVPDALSTASHVIAKVAGIELPQKQWPELIGSLLSTAQQVSAHVKQAAYEALGYLCEEVSSDAVDQDQVNKIVTALVQGMNANEGNNNDVRLAATRALYNALGFAQAFSFIKSALPRLVPLLLKTLVKQEEDQEDQDEGAWNLAMAGGTCLGLVARTVGDDIVPLVKPFIEENMTELDSRLRDAAIHAFGSIMEGPSPVKLTPIVKFALNIMLDALTTDPNSHVKDTTAWTIGRIFEFVHGSSVAACIITPADIEQIISALLQSKNDAKNVSEEACRALYFLAKGYKDVVSDYFWDIVKSLLRETNCKDAGESRLRAAAYETLTEVVRCSTDESDLYVLQLLPFVMERLQQTVEAHKLSSDERERQNELQGLCGCLLAIIKKLVERKCMKYHLMMYVNQIMYIVLDVLACGNATVHEKAMLIIGALATAATPASATGPHFAKYMPALLKYLEMGLKNTVEYHVCAVTVGVVGDICRLLDDEILPYSGHIMTELLTNIFTNELHRSVRPAIFSCFGDIALAIKENFEKYLETAMRFLHNADVVSGADDEMIEYTNSLWNGVLKAYSGILQGFKSTPSAGLLAKYAIQIVKFINEIYCQRDMDDVVRKSAIEVIGDLADTLGNAGVYYIKASLVCIDILNGGSNSSDPLMKEAAERAKQAIYHVIYARPALANHRP